MAAPPAFTAIVGGTALADAAFQPNEMFLDVQTGRNYHRCTFRVRFAARRSRAQKQLVGRYKTGEAVRLQIEFDPGSVFSRPLRFAAYPTEVVPSLEGTGLRLIELTWNLMPLKSHVDVTGDKE